MVMNKAEKIGKVGKFIKRVLNNGWKMDVKAKYTKLLLKRMEHNVLDVSTINYIKLHHDSEKNIGICGKWQWIKRARKQE